MPPKDKLTHKKIKTNNIKVKKEDVNKYGKGLYKGLLTPYRFLFKMPILLDKNNTVLCGQRKVLAAKKMELEYVDVIIVDDALADILVGLSNETRAKKVHGGRNEEI